jgi:hypothetical protein
MIAIQNIFKNQTTVDKPSATLYSMRKRVFSENYVFLTFFTKFDKVSRIQVRSNSIDVPKGLENSNTAKYVKGISLDGPDRSPNTQTSKTWGFVPVQLATASYQGQATLFWLFPLGNFQIFTQHPHF